MYREPVSPYGVVSECVCVCPHPSAHYNYTIFMWHQVVSEEELMRSLPWHTVISGIRLIRSWHMAYTIITIPQTTQHTIPYTQSAPNKNDIEKFKLMLIIKCSAPRCSKRNCRSAELTPEFSFASRSLSFWYRRIHTHTHTREHTETQFITSFSICWHATIHTIVYFSPNKKITIIHSVDLDSPVRSFLRWKNSDEFLFLNDSGFHTLCLPIYFSLLFCLISIWLGPIYCSISPKHTHTIPCVPCLIGSHHCGPAPHHFNRTIFWKP